MKRSEYEKYKDRVAETIKSRNLTRFYPDENTTSFASNYDCETCRTYETRARVHFIGITPTQTRVPLTVCLKCAHFLVHGKLDDETMSTMEEDTLARAYPKKKKKLPSMTVTDQAISFDSSLAALIARPYANCDCASCVRARAAGLPDRVEYIPEPVRTA